MTSYLTENEAENQQNGDVRLAQIPDFKMEYLENIWRIKVSDGSFFFSFFTLLHLSQTVFRPEVPLNLPFLLQ